jgi:hypothetical protein
MGATLEFVEHSGKAADAGWTDLDRKEQRMVELSFEPLKARSGNPTATGKALEAAKNLTDIEVWVRLLEAGLELAYAMAATWRKITLPEDFAVDIWSEFAVALTKLEDLSAILDLRKEGDLSQETTLNEYKRRGVLGDRIDVEEEILRTDKERQDAAEAFAATQADLADDDDDTDDDDTEPGGEDDDDGTAEREGEAA